MPMPGDSDCQHAEPVEQQGDYGQRLRYGQRDAGTFREQKQRQNQQNPKPGYCGQTRQIAENLTDRSLNDLQDLQRFHRWCSNKAHKLISTLIIAAPLVGSNNF
jgi:hypothetical protein